MLDSSDDDGEEELDSEKSSTMSVNASIEVNVVRSRAEQAMSYARKAAVGAHLDYSQVMLSGRLRDGDGKSAKEVQKGSKRLAL